MELLKNLEGMSADEQMTAVVELQKAAMKTLEDQKQASIGKSAELVIQGLKKIKSDFEAKFDSLNYDIQTKVASLKDGEQGLQGPKGEQGDRGLDGSNGRDGRDGKDGKDGLDGVDGVGVRDAKIDFDGSLVISLTDGREINCGEVVSVDVAKQIQKVTHNIQTGSGGDSQTVLDAIAAIQATIATYGTMATQNKTSVDIEGGTIDNTTIGATTPSTGVFTTLTATGQTSLGGDATLPALRVNALSGITRYLEVTGSTAAGVTLQAQSAAGNPGLIFIARQAGVHSFSTNGTASNEQMRVSHTASAVNYVQVTGAATGAGPTISAQGSDSQVRMTITTKSSQDLFLNTGATGGWVRISPAGSEVLRVVNVSSNVNYFVATGSAAGSAPAFSVNGSDTNIPLVLQPKGTGALQAQQTDSTATGGNARGANAVDWQTARGSAVGVASGVNSVVGGGYGNIASGGYGIVAGGLNNSASGIASAITGGSSINSSGIYSASVGGNSNTNSAYYGSLVGGQSNTAAGHYNFIGGGFTNSGTSGSAVTTQSGTMNGTTAVTLSGSNASIKVGQLITGTSIATFTYVAAISGTSLTLSQAASGSSTSTLSFYTPHGVVVGGGNNQATGSYSFIGGGGDAGTAANRNVASGAWSTVGGGLKNISSGQGSVIGGGYGNTSSGIGSVIVGGGLYGTIENSQFAVNSASGTSSFIGAGFQNFNSGYAGSIVGGYGNTVNSNWGVASGSFATTRSIINSSAFGAYPFGQTSGACQTGLLMIGVQTTNATPAVATSDGSAAASTNQVILPNNSAYYFRGEVVSGVTGGGNTKGWFIEGVIKRGANAASTALVGTPTVTSSYADAGASTWTIAVTADTTNGGLAVTFTGQAGTTIRTVAQIRTTEMTY